MPKTIIKNKANKTVFTAPTAGTYQISYTVGGSSNNSLLELPEGYSINLDLPKKGQHNLGKPKYRVGQIVEIVDTDSDYHAIVKLSKIKIEYNMITITMEGETSKAGSEDARYYYFQVMKDFGKNKFFDREITGQFGSKPSVSEDYIIKHSRPVTAENQALLDTLYGKKEVKTKTPKAKPFLTF